MRPNREQVQALAEIGDRPQKSEAPFEPGLRGKRIKATGKPGGSYRKIKAPTGTKRKRS